MSRAAVTSARWDSRVGREVEDGGHAGTEVLAATDGDLDAALGERGTPPTLLGRELTLSAV